MISHNKLISRHKVLQAAGKDCRGVLHRPIGQEVCFDIFLPRIIIINNNKTVYSSSSWSEIASPHFSFPSQMVQDRRHRRDRQVWRCQDCRQEEGPGQASIRRVSQHHFILTVSSQLRFLNYYVKVYFPYRDLSPHRPFQELIQYKQNNWLHQLKILLLF